MAIRHKFVNPKADGADATVTRPSNWNDDHNHPPFEYTIYGGDAIAPAAVWTNLPATGVVEAIPQRMRHKVDLTHVAECRIVVTQVAVGLATTRFALQYNLDNGATWTYLDGTVGTSISSGGPFVLGSTTANLLLVGAWTTLHASAKADVFVRAVAMVGNGTADPSVGGVFLQVR